jgi:hypothetical protein
MVEELSVSKLTDNGGLAGGNSTLRVRQRKVGKRCIRSSDSGQSCLHIGIHLDCRLFDPWTPSSACWVVSIQPLKFHEGTKCG